MRGVWRWCWRAWALVLGALCPAVVLACAICAPQVGERTLLERMAGAPAVVLARVGSTGVFVEAARLKGSAAAVPWEQVHVLVDAPWGSGTDLALLLHDGQGWSALGAVPRERQEAVLQAWALRRDPQAPANAADPQWPARTALYAPLLQHPSALLARLAYEELSQAPYAQLRQGARLLPAGAAWGWLQDPALAQRQPLYALLAGFTATAAQAQALRVRLLRPGTPQGDSAAVQSGLMAALLEAQGDSGLAWLQQHFLQDPQRSDTQVQSALLALRVHAQDGTRVTREAVVRALAAYIEANPQRAGYAASDLGDWGRWEFTGVFERLLDSDQPQAFASRYAMVLYLLRNPQAPAQAALERLRAKGRL
ncbi:MAG: hypothetical protein ACT4NV_08415 [Rhodoferax sp.]